MENFRNVFTVPSFCHFTPLMLSVWALTVVTGGPVSLASSYPCATCTSFGLHAPLLQSLNSVTNSTPNQ